MICLPLRFRRSPQDSTVEKICAAWQGIDFKEGQNSQFGVDCSHFVAQVLDSLEGIKKSHLLVKIIVSQAGLHSGRETRRAIRRILTLYCCLERSRSVEVLSGDWLVTGPEDGGPGHLHIVGGVPNRLWQATPPRVQLTDFSLPEGRRLFGIYRSRNRHNWPC